MSKILPTKVSYLAGDSSVPKDECFDFFEQARAQRFGEVYFKYDEATGLKAIIAIHNTNLGPALGGTRCLSYGSSDMALRDVMRLARGMSYKSAFFNLPYGGGKGVLIRPPRIVDRKAYFESYGEFIEHLGGRFITAVDSGTQVSDMDIIAHKTRYVVSTSLGHGDPSPFTAKGVALGIEAAAKVAFGRDDLQGIHVAIQGVGNVGYHLAKELNRRGARLTVCDVNPAAAQCCADEFGATVVGDDRIYAVDCDIFSPCALGGVINDETVGLLKAKAVCGAANNQLEEERHGEALHNRGILFAPDYVANAGGLLHAVPGDKSGLRERIAGIYDALIDIFQRSKRSDEPCHTIADRIAEAVLYHPKRKKAS